jgi:hypothetical protein
MRSVEKTLNCKMIISLEYMREHSYLSPSLRQWLIVSSVQRDGNSLSPLIPFLYAVLPRGEPKECMLPLLQQRSVCCRCCSKGVCVAAVAAKERSESCSKRNCVPAIPTLSFHVRQDSAATKRILFVNLNRQSTWT